MSDGERLTEERRARMAAERLLQRRSSEFTAASQSIGRRALGLTREVSASRAEAADLRARHQQALTRRDAESRRAERAEERLALALQASRDSIALFGTGGTLLSANPAYIALFEGLEEVRPGITVARILELLTEEGLVDTGTTPPGEWRAAMAARAHQDGPKPVQIRLWDRRCLLLTTHRGTGGDILSILREIPATTAAGAAAARRSVTAFVDGMAHGVRTPLNGILGMAEHLEGTALDASQRADVTSIRRSGERLLARLNGALRDASIAGAAQADTFDLENCLAQAAGQLAAISGSGASVHSVYDPVLPGRFQGPGSLVADVLEAMAVRTAARGRGPAVLQAGGEPGSGKGAWQLRISARPLPGPRAEQGGGGSPRPAPADAAAMLRRARKLARRLGGRLHLDTPARAGGGIELLITLNAAPRPNPAKSRSDGFEATAPGGGAAAIAAGPGTEALRRMRVLAADDDRINRLVFEKFAAGLNIDLRFAENGVEAVAAYREFAPDLVFMDISMPEMDGWEAALCIRQLESEAAGRRAVIGALSAHATGGTQADLQAAGLDFFLCKPLRKAQLYGLIQRHQPKNTLPPAPSPPAP